MQYRRKWRNCWDRVKYCSARCQRGQGSGEGPIETTLVEMAAARPAPATLCPSEVVRKLYGERANWPEGAMETVRRAARRLVARGEMDMLQGGAVVDAATAKGPIRLRARRGQAL